MVTPCYGNFPVNAEACENIIKRYWNPTAEVVRRWVELCSLAGWAQIGLSRLVCLKLLNIQQLDKKLDMLRVYVSTIGQQLQKIDEKSQGL